MIGNALTTTASGDLQQVPSLDHLVDLLQIQDPEFLVDKVSEEEYDVPNLPTNPSKDQYHYRYAKH
jgi:hypothetical protein